MSESFAKFLVDLFWGVLVFITAKVVIAGYQALRRKFRTPKDPVTA